MVSVHVLQNQFIALVLVIIIGVNSLTILPYPIIQYAIIIAWNSDASIALLYGAKHPELLQL